MASQPEKKRKLEDTSTKTTESSSPKVATKLYQLVNFDTWLKENEDALLPPVCNKLMYSDQLKIMFVGGKNDNERSDYHLEEGEELFYQIKGDMLLPIIEKGIPKDVVIKEGEMFLLPPRIPHSPRRKAGTLGLVIERERRPKEMDALRWFKPSTAETIWEKWFYCYDLGVQLGPVIGEFKRSEACQKKEPNLEDGTVLREEQLPWTPDIKTTVHTPVHFQNWLKENTKNLQSGPIDILKGKEFTITIYNGEQKNIKNNYHSELYFYQVNGSSQLILEETNDKTEEINLKHNDMILIRPNTPFTLTTLSSESVLLQLVWWSADQTTTV